MKKINKIFTFILLYLGISFTVYSQVSVTPLRFGANTSYQTLNNARVAANDDTIKDFFLDDFTTNGMSLNTKFWKPSGVTVNNTKAINPPTQNVITFDGIDNKGTPYNFSNGFSYGICDELESNVIKLKPTSDSIFVQFYWQAGGLVEMPDSVQTDSISLFLKSTKSNIWKKYWTYTPHKDSIDHTKFHYEKIYIPDSILNNYFQIKLQSFGNQSGAWDNWHIDYINIDKITAHIQDYGLNYIDNSLLKNYTVITNEQLNGFENIEIKDSIFNKVLNLNTDSLYLTRHYDVIANNSIKESINESQTSIAPYPSNFSSKTTINKILFQNLSDSCSFSIKKFLDKSDETSDILTTNDTISVTSLVRNYLAYDDGSAEGAFGINQAAGRVIYKIKLNRPDTISAVDFSWVQSVNNLNGTTFKLLVLKDLDSVKFSKQVSLVYGDTLDKFTRYKLDSGIVVADSFYIGYEQNSANVLTLGFDKNTSSNSNMFYAIDYKTGTSKYNYRNFNKTTGSLMMRPVFEKGVKTSTHRKANPSGANFNVYPNPSNGIIYIDNDTIANLKIYSLVGNEIPAETYKLTNVNNIQTLDISNLETGFYILYLYNKNNFVSTKKVFIQP